MRGEDKKDKGEGTSGAEYLYTISTIGHLKNLLSFGASPLTYTL
jgi:hypothetical protein